MAACVGRPLRVVVAPSLGARHVELQAAQIEPLGERGLVGEQHGEVVRVGEQHAEVGAGAEGWK
eukprot:6726107-Pyramimonas_sp.AAC.1